MSDIANLNGNKSYQHVGNILKIKKMRNNNLNVVTLSKPDTQQEGSLDPMIAHDQILSYHRLRPMSTNAIVAPQGG